MATVEIQTSTGVHRVEIPDPVTPRKVDDVRATLEGAQTGSLSSLASEGLGSVPDIPDPLGRANPPTIGPARAEDRPGAGLPAIPERSTLDRLMRLVGISAGGAGMAVPSLAGLPGDLLNTVPALGNLIAPGEPFARLPIGSQEARAAFRQIPEALGMPPPLQPETRGERFAERIGEEVGQGALTIGGMGRIGSATMPRLGQRGINVQQTINQETRFPRLRSIRNSGPSLINLTQSIAGMPQRRLQLVEGMISAIQAGFGQEALEQGFGPLGSLVASLVTGFGADGALTLVSGANRLRKGVRRRFKQEEVAEEEVVTFLRRQFGFNPQDAEDNLVRSIQLAQARPEAPGMTLSQASGSPAMIASEFTLRGEFPRVNAEAIAQSDRQMLALSNEISQLNQVSDADIGMQRIVDNLQSIRAQGQGRAQQNLQRAQRNLGNVRSEMQRQSQEAIAGHRQLLQQRATRSNQEFNRISAESARLREDLAFRPGGSVLDPQRAVQRGSEIRVAIKQAIDRFYAQARKNFAIDAEAGAPAPGLFQRIDDLRAQHALDQERFPQTQTPFPDGEVAAFQRAISSQGDVRPGSVNTEAPQPVSLDEAMAMGMQQAGGQQIDPSSTTVTLKNLQDFRSNVLASMRERGSNRFKSQLMEAINDASVDVARLADRADIVEQLTRARADYRRDIPKFTTDAVREVMQRGQRTRDPLTGMQVAVEPAAVARAFWGSRQDIGSQQQRMQQFQQVVGDNKLAVDAMTEHALAEFHTTGIIDPSSGKVDTKRWRKWLAEHREGLAVLESMQPGVTQKLTDITSVHENAERLAAAAKATQVRLERGLAGRDPVIRGAEAAIRSSDAEYNAFLKQSAIQHNQEMKQASLQALGATDALAETRVRALLSESDPRQLRQNVSLLAGRISTGSNSDEAMNGLRRLFHDSMIERGKLAQFAENPAAPELERRLGPGQMQELRKRYDGAYKALYEPEHLRAVDQWNELLAIANRNKRRPFGFGTEDPGGMRIVSELKNLLRTVQPTALVSLSRRLFRQGLMKVGEKGLNQVADRHDAAISRIFNEQLFNPDLAFWLNDLRRWRGQSPEFKVRMLHAWMLKLGLEEREHSQEPQPPRTDAEIRAVFP